ncbi:MAG: hypothetical protein IKC69_03350 [Clostridia bacterium]|nr:hypothetical protein [Clostridia bacterium]
MFTKKKRLAALGLWMLFLSLLYWGLGETPVSPILMLAYALCCAALSVLYVLVNGGLRPILDEEKRKEESTREKYLRDKGKLHPIKRRDRYRRFRVKTEAPSEEPAAPLPPRPNPLKLSDENRILYSHVILVTVIPFYLIFLLDWVYATFFA